MLTVKRKIRILDFDIENRPLSYWADRPTAEITAIASCWVDDVSTMEIFLLGEATQVEMLEAFKARFDEADMVTGHYIRRHDLPIINGAMLEYGLPQLTAKLSCDTKLDMRVKGDIPATQEYLSDILGVPLPKVHMTQKKWRDANRLTPEGLQATKERVSGDVLQHMFLRNKMVERNLLKAPRIWKP